MINIIHNDNTINYEVLYQLLAGIIIDKENEDEQELCTNQSIDN